MPSIQHEALIQLFRQRPALAAEVLADGFGIDVPTFRAARLASGELNEVIPTEYRADAVVTLTDGNRPALAVIVEVQLGKDPGKCGVLAHGRAHPDSDRVLRAFPAALAALDPDHATLYAQVVADALPEAARRYLEDLMTTGYRKYKTDFMARYINQGRAEGEAQGEAKAVLTVLAARCVDVPDDARDRIAGCTDLEQLDTWLRRAVTVDSIDDLFDESRG